MPSDDQSVCTIFSVFRADLSPVADESLGPAPLPPCGHPQCARAARSATLLSYTWLPAAAAAVPAPAVHSTAACRGQCAACRSLAQPPPSYTKLFLEDQPPAYHDEIVLKDTENTCIQITSEDSDSNESNENNENNDTVINIQEIVEESSANNRNEDSA